MSKKKARRRTTKAPTPKERDRARRKLGYKIKATKIYRPKKKR